MDIVETPDLFGLILRKQLDSEDPIYHLIERIDGYVDCVNTQRYFATPKNWLPNEEELLDFAESLVLDIGCGAGRHAIYLQEKGLDVIGLDISNNAIQVCKKRGLKKIILGTACNLPPFKEPFNTFLLLFNNFGICGKASETVKLLKNLYQLGTPAAKILLSYADVSQTQNPCHLAFQKRNLAAGKLKGEITIRFRFQGYVGSWFDIWLPTNDEFRNTVQKSGWKIDKDLEHAGFHHVLLRKSDSSAAYL